MSEKEDNKDAYKKDENVTFDMYHFFSRKDVLAVIALVVFLLLLFLFFQMTPSTT